MGTRLPLSNQWNTTGYVCRACRQQLLASKRHHSLRHQSSLHTESTDNKSSGSDETKLRNEVDPKLRLNHQVPPLPIRRVEAIAPRVAKSSELTSSDMPKLGGSAKNRSQTVAEIVQSKLEKIANIVTGKKAENVRDGSAGSEDHSSGKDRIDGTSTKLHESGKKVSGSSTSSVRPIASSKSNDQKTGTTSTPKTAKKTETESHQKTPEKKDNKATPKTAKKTSTNQHKSVDQETAKKDVDGKDESGGSEAQSASKKSKHKTDTKQQKSDNGETTKNSAPETSKQSVEPKSNKQKLDTTSVTKTLKEAMLTKSDDEREIAASESRSPKVFATKSARLKASKTAFKKSPTKDSGKQAGKPAFKRVAAMKAKKKSGVASETDSNSKWDVEGEDLSTTITPKKLEVQPLDIEQPRIPTLSFGLDRALFKSGVYMLQDPHSKVYNFDPYLQNIMPVQEFNYAALKPYKTSSADTTLSDMAKQYEKKYVGSTSSMTSVLGQFHFLLSNWRPLNLGMLSRRFGRDLQRSFTKMNRSSASIFLRWKNGMYAIDADKEHDSPNILMMLGKSMEKLLTLPKEEFERYRRGDEQGVPQEETDAPEAFQYSTFGDLLMRSQLDAVDSRLPGNGTFDLKTRAVLPIRMNAMDFEPMLGYELLGLQGPFNSYEKEYYDMLRSTMLKYMLQARIGRMDGIFLAYHNIERIFGFQYVPMHEIDFALHGSTNLHLGDQEFKMSLHMLNDVLNRATAKYPEQSLRLMFKTSDATKGSEQASRATMAVYVEPMTDKAIDEIQSTPNSQMDAYLKKWDINDHARLNEAEVEKESSIESEQSNAIVATSKDVDEVQGEDTVNISEEESSTDQNLTDDLLSKASKGLTPPPLAKELLALHISVRQRLNGVDVSRPRSFGAKEKWVVKYTIQDVSESKKARTRYQTLQYSKARFMARFKFEEGIEEKEVDHYITVLRRMAAEGRLARKKIDEKDDGKPPVVWGV